MELEQVLFQFLPEYSYWLGVKSQINWQTVSDLGPNDCEVSYPKYSVRSSDSKATDSADRRCRRRAIDVTGTQLTARYGGAIPCKHS